MADPPPREDLTTYRYRTFFWPAVLILVGLIALLVNTGQLSVDRLNLLLDLWPLILIVIGVELVIRRSVQSTAADVATALIVILAIVFAAAYVAASPSPSTHTVDASTEVGNISRAAVEIEAGAATVTVSGNGDLGSSLYRAHVDYTGPRPKIALDRESGTLHVGQATSNIFKSQRFVLNLELNPSVPWTITQNTAAATDTINASHLHLAGLTLSTDASRDEITLGSPSGMVPVQIKGGSLTVRVHRPAATAASVSVSGGAVTLSLDGRNQHVIGQVKDQSSGFGGATDGYRIQVYGGACSVTVDAVAESG